MESYDLVMIVVLLGATAFGAFKGMAWQIASLASFGVSYFVALRFSAQLAPQLPQEAPWNKFTAMLVLYMGTSLAIWIVFRVVRNFIDRVKLNEFDRQVGAIFGAAKGVLFCVAITFFAVTLSQTGREAVMKSRSGYYIAQLLRKADAVMPPELHEVLDPYLNPLEQQLEPIQPSRAQLQYDEPFQNTRGETPYGDPYQPARDNVRYGEAAQPSSAEMQNREQFYR